MGLWQDLKESYKNGCNEAEAKLNGTYKEPPKPRKKADDYHPKKEKDGVIRADIYSTYGTHDLDKWFEQGAPHLIDAIYQTRDGIKRQQHEYDKLEQNYDELKAQYEHITKILETLTNNASR